MGFNGTLTAAMSTPGGDYTLDIGKKDINGNLTPMTYHMPSPYVAPLGIGGAATVMIPAHQDLTYEWATPTNDKGKDGNQHLRDTYFNLTFFVDPWGSEPSSSASLMSMGTRRSRRPSSTSIRVRR